MGVSSFNQFDAIRKGQDAPERMLAARLADARAKYQLRDFAAVHAMLDNFVAAASSPSSETSQHRDLLAGVAVLRGQLLYDEGRSDDATTHVAPAIQLLQGTKPEQSRKSADMGIALMIAGRRSEAEPYLQAAVQMGLPAWDAARWLGFAFKDQKRYEEAEPLLNIAATCLPGFAAVRVAWAEALEALDRKPEAAEQYRQAAINLPPESATEVEDALNRALRLQPEHATTLFLLGEFARLRERSSEALEFLNRALERQPDHAPALASKAALHASAGQRDLALALVDEAVSADPDNQGVRTIQIGILNLFGRNEDLLRVLETTFPETTEPAVLELKAAAEMRLGRWTAALKTTETGLRKHPDSRRLLESRVRALIGLGDLTEAQKVIQGALRRRAEDPDLLLLQAHVLFLVPDPIAALAVLNGILADNPDHPQALQKKGEWLVLHDPAEAERVLSRVVTLSPDSVDGRFHLGEALRRMGRFEEAREHVEFALKNDPDDPMKIGTLGQVLEGLEQFDGAIELLRRALEKDPALFWAWEALEASCRQSNQMKTFSQILDHAMQSHQDDPRVLATLGKALSLVPDTPRAIDTLQRTLNLAKAARVNPVKATDLEALTMADLGTVYRMGGQPEQALKAYDSALALQPTCTAAVSGKAWLALDADRPQRAVELLAQLRTHASAEPVLLGQYGEALRRVERWSEADEALERAARQAPAHPWIAGARAVLLTEIGRFEEAAAVAAQCAKAEPSAFVFGILGWAWENVGRGDGAKAREAYESGLKMDPADPWCLKGLGNAHRLLGNLDKADSCYDSVVKKATSEVQRAREYTLSLLGWCHYQLGHASEAVRLFSSAISVNPQSVSDCFDLGLALLSAKAELSARESYARGVALLSKIEHQGRRRALAHVACCDLLGALEHDLRFLPSPGLVAAAEDALQRLKAKTHV